MKIIEALKKIKHLDRKIEKTSGRVTKWCSYFDDKENPNGPVYNEEDIQRMLQQIDDWASEKAQLRHKLHKTNMETTVDLWGKTYTLDELLGLKEIVIPQMIEIRKKMRRKEKGRVFGEENKNTTVINQFDPKKRDQILDNLDSQKEEIDSLVDRLSIETNVVE